MSAFTEPFDLEQRRVAIGVSRHEVACGIGVSQEAVRRWELGWHFPSEANLVAWRAYIDERERHRLAELLERHWLREASSVATASRSRWSLPSSPNAVSGSTGASSGEAHGPERGTASSV